MDLGIRSSRIRVVAAMVIHGIEKIVNMTGLIVSVAVLVLLAGNLPAFAQDNFPRAEIFGGFSFLPAEGDDFPRKDAYGFQANVSGNLNSWFGMVFDFGGQYRNVSNLGRGFEGITAKTSVYEYLAGPRFTARTKRLDFFLHGLAGVAKGNSGLNGFSDSGFAAGVGFGWDFKVNDRIAIRAAQFDFIGSFVDILEDNIRLGFGTVIRIGGR